MKKRMHDGVAVAGGFIFSLTGTPVPEPEAPPPNVILFMLDDQGFGDGAVLGHPYMQTPHIDRLAQEGTVFNQFYITSPVCSPSRVSFLTGRFPAELGVHHIFINQQSALERRSALYLPEVPTVMNLLREVGYRTAHFGKWHMTSGGGGFDSPTPDDYGLDEVRIGGGWGALPGDRFDTEIDYYRAHSTGLFVDAAIDFIERNRENGPFFVNLWTLVPHSPLDPTPEELAVYDGLTVSPHDFTGHMPHYMESTETYTDQMRVYCAAMTGLDIALGKLLDYLDENDLADNTIILFTSDNGPEDYRAGSQNRNAGMGYAGRHRARKRSLYEGGTRVPFLVRWPGRVPAGRVDEASVLSSVDLLPTLAALGGVPQEVMDRIDLNGEDISPAWAGGIHTREKPLFWEWKWDVTGAPAWGYRPPSLAIRDGEWKLFCEPDGAETELYHIVDDPEERENVAGENPEVAAALKTALLEWKGSLADPVVVAYYRFGDDPAGFLADSSGNNNHLFQFNRATPATREGAGEGFPSVIPATGEENRYVARFETGAGIVQALQANPHETLCSPGFTIEALVSPGDLSQNRTIASRWDSGERAWRLFLNVSQSALHFQMSDDGESINSGKNTALWRLAVDGLEEGKTYYTAAAFQVCPDDGMVLTLYTKNLTDHGELRSQTFSAEDILSIFESRAPLTLGADLQEGSLNNPWRFDGRLDEVRISNRMLDETELLVRSPE